MSPVADTLRQRIGQLFADEDQLILVDYLLLILAFASAIILFLEWNIELQPQEVVVLNYVDMATQVLFGLGFVGKFLAADHPVEMARKRWPEAIGALPLTRGVSFITAQWFPVQQIVVVIARFSIGLDRHLGERALSRIFQRYRSAVVEELTDPILVRATHITQGILEEGTYAASVGKNLDARRPEIHATVEKAMRANPRLAAMMRVPGIPRVVRESTDAAVDATVASLTSEEMDHIVRSTLDQVFEDFRDEVRKSRWKETGVGVGDIFRGNRRGDGGGDEGGVQVPRAGGSD